MNTKEIEKKSRIYDTSKLDPSHKMWQYYNEVNKAASFTVAMYRPELLNDKNRELTEFARKTVHESGYQYKKKSSRSKQFGQSNVKKREYVSEALKTQRLQELQEDLDDTNTQMALLTRQREKHANVQQFGLAANVTEQMSQLRGKKRKLEQELTLLQQKKKDCERQKSRVRPVKDNTTYKQTSTITAFMSTSATTSLKQKGTIPKDRQNDAKGAGKESTSTSETDSTSVTTSTKQDLNVSKESQHDKKEAAKESTSTSEIDSSDHFLV